MILQVPWPPSSLPISPHGRPASPFLQMGACHAAADPTSCHAAHPLSSTQASPHRILQLCIQRMAASQQMTPSRNQLLSSHISQRSHVMRKIRKSPALPRHRPLPPNPQTHQWTTIQWCHAMRASPIPVHTSPALQSISQPRCSLCRWMGIPWSLVKRIFPRSPALQRSSYLPSSLAQRSRVRRTCPTSPARQSRSCPRLTLRSHARRICPTSPARQSTNHH